MEEGGKENIRVNFRALSQLVQWERAVPSAPVPQRPEHLHSLCSTVQTFKIKLSLSVRAALAVGRGSCDVNFGRKLVLFPVKKKKKKKRD